MRMQGSEAKGETVEGSARAQLVLLTDINGCFRPGVLTCLMGVSGAGKTTLMDVLAGRKTGVYPLYYVTQSPFLSRLGLATHHDSLMPLAYCSVVTFS